MNTGKRRYREQKRFLRPSLLVLQVEVNEMTMIGRWPERVTFWRDAKVEDLMAIPAAIQGDFPLSRPV
ncbi:hypothetical protein [Mesorhizobium sp.]|uniref:hypothetical protein n=1 Tax=Mesorhizobium sp. TaxID=1871066 RepID=UPI000FE3D10E|nr:hypothetical protein [Mesorhizobium sp.]RWJ03440.1 MAG: hypothetical protein EOR24_32175 [Mesorhizobium sp.]